MKTPLLMIPVLMAVLVTGCSDDRLTNLAREAADRQATQNLEMARVTRESAEAMKRSAEADSKSRQELNAMQHDLIAGHDRLEADRKSLATERYCESLLAPVVQTIGSMLICVLPVAVCWYLLHGLRQEASHPEVAEFLLREITAHEPRILPKRANLAIHSESAQASPQTSLPSNADH